MKSKNHDDGNEYWKIKFDFRFAVIDFQSLRNYENWIANDTDRCSICIQRP